MNLQRCYNFLRQGRSSFNLVLYIKREFVHTKCDRRIEQKSLFNTSRLVSTCEVKAIQKEEGLIMRFLRKIPFLDIDRTKKKAAAYLLYEHIADKINYLDFFEKLDLPDTFYSWFVITELHIWILSVRAMAEGKEDGTLIRNGLLEALWSDVAQRVKKLGAANPSIIRAQVKELSEQLQASLIAYDEGIQSDDIVLAGAIWRRVYQMQYAAPHHLEELVKYTRNNVSILDNMSIEDILKIEPVKWDSL